MDVVWFMIYGDGSIDGQWSMSIDRLIVSCA